MVGRGIQAPVFVTPQWYLPYAFTSVLIMASNVNPFGIDPEATVPILAANVNPFGIDPEQTALISAANTDPFGIDPEQTVVITKGLTPAD